jgi:hypothetical protein
MQTLDYIIKKYTIDLGKPSPFWLKFNRLVDLPQLFKELSFKKGAEIGVWDGKFSEILCQELPKTKIYSIDPWEFYPLYKNFRKPWMFEPTYQKTKEKLSQYPNSEIIRKKSLDAVKDFADDSLDFVFIDADHRFQFITNDIAEWSKKVRSGGIISGHDFAEGHASKDFVHVKAVVEAWTYSYRIHPWFVLDHPLERGWMWVRT